MKCSDDVAIQKWFIEKERIYDFLSSLNLEFDAVRVQILGKEDHPSLNETIAIVRAKEGQRGVMLETSFINNLALVTMKSSSLDKQPREEKKASDSSIMTNKDS